MGANDEVVETVEIEEMDEAREDRERSEIIDSGLERLDAVLVMDGLREDMPGYASIVHRLKPVCWTIAIAEQIEGRR